MWEKVTERIRRHYDLTMRWLMEDENLKLGVEVVGPLDNNVYILACQQTQAAVIVDAADAPEKIIAACHGLSPQAILTTHGHWDHIGAVDDVATQLGIVFRMHEADSELAHRAPDDPLEDGETIRVGKLEVNVVHTPGHTPGSVSFLAAGLLLTGDTLFPGGPGATSSPHSSFPIIMESLKDRLFILPDETPFFPGHGDSSTIGKERLALPDWQRRGW